MKNTLVWSASLILACITTSVSAAAKSCYYPGGNLAPDSPCNTTTTGHSACCGDAQCMTSGLCFDKGLVSRGSCTDPTWKDASCAQYCVDYLPTSGTPMVMREWTTVGDTAKVAWCCDFPLTNGSCRQGFEIQVSAGTVIANTSAPVTSTSTVTMFATATATCQSSNSNSSSSSSSDAGSTSENHDAAIGAGIGVPAVIAIAALMYMWLREKKKTGMMRVDTPTEDMQSAPHGEVNLVPVGGVMDRKEVPVELQNSARRSELA